jgi:hypothetical protein
MRPGASSIPAATNCALLVVSRRLLLGRRLKIDATLTIVIM